MPLYPNPTGYRMAYDRDGTLGFQTTNAGVITALSTAFLQELNNEDSVALPSNPWATNLNSVVLIFPELRDISHTFREHSAAISTIIQTSTNTTNGFDGTWANLNPTAAGAILPTIPNYRTLLAAATNFTAVKAVRIQRNSATAVQPVTFHVYGGPNASGDRLELWHPTLNQALRVTPALFDFEDLQRNGSYDKTFRVKNLSATLTANSITVSREALTDAPSPTKISELSLSYDGGAFGATASVSALAPGAISNVFTLRNAPGPTSVLGLWAQRLVAAAGSWT